MRPRAGPTRGDESGSVSLELVLVVPVLVLLTVFVLWAGRGGRVALTADLAAEEAATLAALCCDEDTAGEPDRDALAEDILEARPWLEFLCVGGLRPDAEPDRGPAAEFVSEHWLDFEPLSAARAGGVGVLGVRFLCETDGAVAPLRGLLPTVTFRGQASEVVIRQPRPPDIGFEQDRFDATEGPGAQLTFTVTSGTPVPTEVTVEYQLDTGVSTADLGVDYTPEPVLAPGAALSGSPPTGTLVIPAGQSEAEIVLDLIDDGFYEGTETVVLTLDPATVAPAGIAQVDTSRLSATGEILDDDAAPHVFVVADSVNPTTVGFSARPCWVDEADATVTFVVRLRNAANTADAPSASPVSVAIRTEDGTAAAPGDYTAATTTLNFAASTPGSPVVSMPFQVDVHDDTATPVGEPTETFKVVLGTVSGATDPGSGSEAVCEIRDDEVTVTVADASADEDGGPLTFTVALSDVPTADVHLGYQLMAHTRAVHSASAGDPCGASTDPADPFDYEPLDSIGGTDPPLVIRSTNPDHREDLTVVICDDAVAEPSETFWLQLEVQSGEAYLEGAVSEHGAVGTIVDDDTPIIDVADVTAAEGDTLEFVVNLTQAGSPANLSSQVTLNYAIEQATPESATEGVDYASPGSCSDDSETDQAACVAAGEVWTPLSGTLTFGPGTAAEATVAVNLLADYVPDEGDETFELRLTDADGATDGLVIAAVTATGTITDDAPPRLSVAGFTGPEDSTQNFTVSLDIAPRTGETVTVAYAVVEDTPLTASSAREGADYASPGSCSDTRHSTEADCDAAGAQWTPLSGTVSFSGSDTIRRVPVRLLADTIDENDETFSIRLTNAQRAYLDTANASAVGVITDVEPPDVTVNHPSADEGEDLTFTVTLNRGVAGQTVEVDYVVENRSAKAGRDFTAPAMSCSDTLHSTEADCIRANARWIAGTLTLDVGNPTRTVAVPTLNDTVVENNETLHLVLSNPQTDIGAVALGDPHIGVGTIVNVNPVTVRVDNPTADEGDPLTFNVHIENVDPDIAPDITAAVVVDYEIRDGTADGGPACSTGSGVDYVQAASGSVTFTPQGATTHSLAPVATCRDNADENDETVFVYLSLAPGTANAGLGDPYGTGTIEDAAPPRLSIGDADGREGETLTFTVTLRDDNGDPAPPDSGTVTVDYATADRTATTADSDYAAASGTLTFTAGAPGDESWQQPIEVQTLTDNEWEPAETFRVDLRNPSDNAVIHPRATGIGTIRADCIARTDPDIPDIIVHEQRYVEGNWQSNLVSLNRPLCFQAQFESEVASVTATPATAADFRSDSHFSPITQTVNAFFLGDPQFSVWTDFSVDDVLDEYDEEYYTLRVRWGSAMPPRFLADNRWVEALYTLLDNDPLPIVSISDASAEAGDAMTFEVSLDTESGRAVTVDYYTADATAAGNGVDYSSVLQTAPQTVMIPAGSTSTTFTVQTAANAPGEDDETFQVLLADPSNALIDDGVGVGTILAQDGPSLSIADASAAEGDTMIFLVTLSEAATQPVSVNYTTGAHSAGLNPATPADDYVAVSDTLTFAAGETWQPIFVYIESDDDDEPDETFLVELSGPTAGVSIADGSAVGTIDGNVECLDLTAPGARTLPDIFGQVTGPSLSGYTDIAVREDSGPLTLTLTFPTPFCHGYTVQYERQSGTAQRNVDYESSYYTAFLMDPLDRDIDMAIPIVDDDLVEGDEYVVLLLRGNTQSRIRKPMEPLTVRFDIVDDDAAEVSVRGARVEEGGVLSFVVALNGPSTRAVTVVYGTEDVGAVAGVDYVDVSGTATIAAGELSTTVLVSTIEDGFYEGDNRLRLVLSSPLGASLAVGGGTADGVILNDDPLPGVTVSDPWVDEGGDLVFELVLEPTRRTASVRVSTRDGTADVGDDYVAVSNRSVVFNRLPVGQERPIRRLVRVRTLTDDILEDTETVSLDLSNRRHLGYLDRIGTGNIRDVTPRRLTVTDASVVEGGVLSFEVSFDGPPASGDITVNYDTADATAASGEDYVAASGVLRILAGRSSAVVEVPTVQDRLDEDVETFTLTLSDPVGATIADGTATGVIIDDDPLPALSVSDAEATENSDGTPITFTISLSTESGRTVTVDYDTSPGTAVAGDDYVARSDTATFRAGQRTVEVDIGVVDDADAEEVESFQLQLSNPTNATRDDSIGVGRILDDDGLIQVLVDDPAETYEAPGAAVTFTVRLSRADPDNATTVVYATEAATATAGDDYTHTTGTLTIDAGDTTGDVTVLIVNDDEPEDPETFRLKLTLPSPNAQVGDDTAVAVIVDDDSLPTASVDDAAAVVEGAAATFTLTLSDPAPREVTIDYAAVANPLAGDAAAVAVQDYNPVSGTVTIAARNSTATVTVPTRDDSLNEATETFWLRLTSPQGATIVDGTAVGTIVDNDPLPTLTIADASTEEGDPLGFAVRLDTASGRTVTVPWATNRLTGDDAADPGDDYTPATGTLTFTSGTTTHRIEIATVEDDTDEPDETLQVTLGEPANASLTDSIAIGAIRDDDSEPRITTADIEVHEDDSPAIFAVTLSHTSSRPVTVTYTTTDGTATAGDDYATAAGATGTLTIPAGLTEGEISVYVADDDIAEGAETFHLTLSDPTNAVIAQGAGTATATIIDNDTTRITINDAQATEADTTIDFEVALNAAATEDIAVTYTTFDGTATQPGDYIAAAATLTIAAGDTTATIPITLTDDTYSEDAESFLIRLSNPPTGAAIVDAEAIGIILDDDNLPVVAAQARGEGGQYAVSVDVREDVGTVTIEVLLDRASDREVRVDYYFNRNSATGAGCPTVANLHQTGTLVFSPGDTVRTVQMHITGDSRTCSWRSIQFSLNLRDPVNAVVADGFAGIAFVNVHDMQQLPVVRPRPHLDHSSSTAPFVRVMENGGPARFWFESSYPYHQDIAVTYSVTALSAVAGSDYENTTGGTATIPANQRRAALAVAIIDDDVAESDETFRVAATAASNGTVVTNARVDMAIIDDDTAYVDVLDAQVGESAGVAAVSVTLDRALSRAVAVEYETRSGTATSPADYSHTSGTATFPSGVSEVLVEVRITDDDVDEDDETFSLVIIDAPGLNISTSSATVTIQDDDGADDLPTVTLPDTSFSESSDYGWVWLTFSEPHTLPVSVTHRYVMAPWLGDRAADWSDVGRWSSPAGWMNTFPAGTDWTAIRVLIDNDDIPEHDERFMVTLYDPVNAILGNQFAWVTIVDDDLPVLSVADEAVSEDGRSVMFTLELHAPGVAASSVDYATMVRTTSSEDAPATPDEDYTHTTGTATFAVGASTATVTVPIISDAADEPDETFLLVLSNPQLLTLGDSTAVGTIVDDDDGFWIDDPSVLEDNPDGEIPFTVRRDHTSASAVTVDYTVTGASATGGSSCSTEGVDYIEPSGSVTLQPSDTEATIDIEVCDDDTAGEGQETLVVELTGVPGRKLTGIGTITDDDGGGTAAVVVVASLSVDEGGSADYTVRLATRPTATVTVAITGHSSTDITLDTDELTFTTINWAAPQTVRVTAASDGDATNDTVTLTHTATGGDYNGVTAATTLIVNDADQPPP